MKKNCIEKTSHKSIDTHSKKKRQVNQKGSKRRKRFVARRNGRRIVPSFFRKSVKRKGRAP